MTACGKFRIIDGISCSPDLRVQHKRTSWLIERISLGSNFLKKYVSNTTTIFFAALSSSKCLIVHQSVCLLVVRLWEKVTFWVSDTTKTYLKTTSLYTCATVVIVVTFVTVGTVVTVLTIVTLVTVVTVVTKTLYLPKTFQKHFFPKKNVHKKNHQQTSNVTKLKTSNVTKLEMWQNSKCDKTEMWQNSKNLNVTKLTKTQNCDKTQNVTTQKLKMWQNS